jgi:predicted TIM-barrel fold metal-dependent hydrolase
MSKNPYPLRIDAFTHIVPQKYIKAALKVIPESMQQYLAQYPIPSLSDLDTRFRIMDKYEGLMHILTLTAVLPTSKLADISKADRGKWIDLIKLGNDELAELVLKYPERFPAAVANLPLEDMDAALKEVDRAVNDLKLRGVQIPTPVNDKPLDSPEFMPLYEKMSQYNLPIWIHPTRGDDYPDYRTEKQSQFRIAATFGWPYETTTAMNRLVFSGILEKYPNLKFITHHCGGMIPYYAARMAQFQDTEEMLRKKPTKNILRKAPIDYFKMFYADTALGGNSPALMLAYSFFGVEHILFGTDLPYDHTGGGRMTRLTIGAVEEMDISDVDRKKIYEDNVKSLLRLPL